MSAPKTIIISATDQMYVPLAQDLFTSILNLKFKAPFDLGLLDIGITDDQRKDFERAGVRVVKAETDIEYPQRGQWEAARPGLRALTAQPFLRRYFPGYDFYIWLDADIWVQTPEAIDAMMDEASRTQTVFIAPELDRCYPAFFEDAQVWKRFGDWYHANFSPEIAGSMMLKPMLNVGMLAMTKDSPAWDAWATLYTESLQKVKPLNEANFMAHQLSFNIVLSQQKIPQQIMPASFNWLTFYVIPKLDRVTNMLVEPLPPYRPISQIHLTRPGKNAIEKVQCTDGSWVERKLTFSGIKGR